MLMTGFDVAGKQLNPCIVLFFQSWTLDTPGKFAAGCVGVAAMGFAIEALICFRRWRQQRLAANGQSSIPANQAVSVACFGLNLILGYLAMLVAMTYSVELFLSVCAGFIVGHAALNVREQAVGETADPCCATSTNQMTDDKARIGKEVKGFNPEPETSTSSCCSH